MMISYFAKKLKKADEKAVKGIGKWYD